MDGWIGLLRTAQVRASSGDSVGAAYLIGVALERHGVAMRHVRSHVEGALDALASGAPGVAVAILRMLADAYAAGGPPRRGGLRVVA